MEVDGRRRLRRDSWQRLSVRRLDAGGERREDQPQIRLAGKGKIDTETDRYFIFVKRENAISEGTHSVSMRR